MTENEAIVIADEFITRRQNSRATEYRLEFLVARQRTPQKWSVVYRIKSLVEPDTVIDGDTVVVVDALSRTARFLGE